MGIQTGIEASLNDVALAAGKARDPTALAELVVERTLGVTGARGAALMWWEPEEGVLIALAARRGSGPDEVPTPVVHANQGVVGAAFASGRSQRVDDYASQVANPSAFTVAHSGLAVPILHAGVPVGVLACYGYAAGTFTAEDTEALERLTAAVGPGLDGMGLLAREKRRASVAGTLAGLMRQGAMASDTLEAAQIACRDGQRLLGADLVGLILRETAHETAWAAISGNRTEAWRSSRYRHDASTFLNGTHLLRGSDIDAMANGRRPVATAEGLRTALMLPLRLGERVQGSLLCGWRFETEILPAFTTIAEALAGFASTMIGAARAADERTALIAAAPVALLALDEEGIITMSDGALAAALGGGPRDVGRPLAEVMADEPELAARMAAHRDEPTPFQGRVRGRVLDIHHVHWRAGSFFIGIDVTAQDAERRRLAHRAVSDELTGLANRPGVLRAAQEAIEAGPICIAIADVRRLDAVNATQGYEAGDELLRLLAEQLRLDLPDAVVLGRSGGDRFSAVMAGADAAGLAGRLSASLERSTGLSAQVSVRCGVAVGGTTRTAEQTFRHADSALALARRGREAIVFYDAKVAVAQETDIVLTNDLSGALENGEITLAYQPVVTLPGQEIHHVEALARWSHPVHGDVDPERFVALAELSGQVRRLTDHVLSTALSDVVAGLGVPVAVNISPLDLSDPAFPEAVTRAIAARGIRGDQLILELTESRELEARIGVLGRLDALGVTLSIDDFGRGWSSLELLKRVPAAELKIDRAFVSDLPDDTTDEAIVRAAVNLAAALGLRVVAEGVETDAALSAVSRLGCDLVQGYLVSRPLDLTRLTEWLDRHRRRPSG